MKPLTLIEIAEQWIRWNNYDGLLHPDGECGCSRKFGLFACNLFESGPHDKCRPAYLREAKPGYRIIDDDGEDHSWVMTPSRTTRIRQVKS